MGDILANKIILITRSAVEAADIIQAVKDKGGKTVVFPTIQICPPDDWADSDSAITSLNQFDWLVFTSKNSVDAFLSRVNEIGHTLGNIQIAAIGSKTAKHLIERGMEIQLQPDSFTATDLVKAFKKMDMSGKRVLVPVSDIARTELTDGLTEQGAMVERIVVYKTCKTEPENLDQVKSMINKDSIDCFTFFSPSAFDNFSSLLGDEIMEGLKRKQPPMAVIGPTTANAVRSAGFFKIIQAKNSTSTDLINALLGYY